MNHAPAILAAPALIYSTHRPHWLSNYSNINKNLAPAALPRLSPPKTNEIKELASGKDELTSNP